MNRKIVFPIIILLSFSWLHMANAIKKPWYHEYFHKKNGADYNKNCNLINTLQKMHHTVLLAFYLTTYKKSNLDKATNIIKKQLKEFEIWLTSLEQEALLAIKKKYNINDNLWKLLLTDIIELKQIYNNEMLNNHNTVHDQNIPTEIYETLIALLKQNNINPQSIHFKMISDQKEIDENRGIIAKTRSFIEQDTNGNLSISRHYIPSNIEIFPRTNNATAMEKISYCAHEIQHLLQHHGITSSILSMYLNHYYKIEMAELEKSSEYHALSQIHEAQAEILSATSSAQIAASFKAMRNKDYYPDHLYEEHFFHLSTIDTLWKVHDRLEHIRTQSSNGEHCFKEKINNLAVSIKQLFS